MAGYLVLFTSLTEDTISIDEVLQLYRLRWQIEIAFKRLKSLVEIDELTAKNPELVQSCLYAGLILALLTKDIAKEVEANLNKQEISNREVSIWRIFAVVVQQLRNAILSSLSLSLLRQQLSCCWRNMCEPPRKRRLRLGTSWLQVLKPLYVSAQP